MRKKCFVLLICVFIGLLIFSVISCSKKLNPFNPYAGLENEPKWFLKPEDQIKPFMQDTLIFRSEVNNNNPDSPKKYIEYLV